jgi:hypothetical protein
MKCGGWSQFDPKFSDPDALNAFMDAAAAAAANSRAALTLSPPLDVIKSASGGLAGERGFALTFSPFGDRHKVRGELAHGCESTVLLRRNYCSSLRNGWTDFERNFQGLGDQPAAVQRELRRWLSKIDDPNAIDGNVFRHLARAVQ